MTAEQITALAAEVAADPQGLGLQAFATAGNDTGIADALNALTGPGVGAVPLHTPVNERTLMGTIGSLAAATVMATLATAAANGLTLNGTAYPAAFFALINRRLQDVGPYATPGGLDAGDAEFPAFVGLLQGAGVLTAPQAAALVALGTRAASRAEVLFGAGTVVGQSDVSRALRGM